VCLKLLNCNKTGFYQNYCKSVVTFSIRASTRIALWAFIDPKKCTCFIHKKQITTEQHKLSNKKYKVINWLDFRVFIDFRQVIGIKLAFFPQRCSMRIANEGSLKVLFPIHSPIVFARWTFMTFFLRFSCVVCSVSGSIDSEFIFLMLKSDET
jgi:hypothetical protein